MKPLKRGDAVLITLPAGRFGEAGLRLFRARVLHVNEPGGPGDTFVAALNGGSEAHAFRRSSEHITWVRGHYGTRAASALATTVALGDRRGEVE